MANCSVFVSILYYIVLLLLGGKCRIFTYWQLNLLCYWDLNLFLHNMEYMHIGRQMLNQIKSVTHSMLHLHEKHHTAVSVVEGTMPTFGNLPQNHGLFKPVVAVSLRCSRA